MDKNVQLKYRLYRRRNGNYYWQENGSKRQGTLRTINRREAERLLNAMNESHREPTLNLNLARAYLVAHDPQMARRTWQEVRPFAGQARTYREFNPALAKRDTCGLVC